MAPNSPPPLRQGQGRATLAPSPTIVTGSHSRSPPHAHPLSPTRPSPRLAAASSHRAEPSSSSSKGRPTIAEAYATANNPKGRDGRVEKDSHHAAAKSKPIFDWITRKLGGGRRATLDGSSGMPGGPRQVTSPDAAPSRGPNGPGGRKGGRGGLTLSPRLPNRSNGNRDSPSSYMARSESLSLRSYSMSFATSVNSTERDRRRIANNPYPSIPVPPVHRDSTIGSISVSFLSRSRTPSLRSLRSLRSEGSRPRAMMDMDDASARWTGLGADEDASIRPCPPSHPSSPTPSQSLLSRSASASLLSPAVTGPRRSSSPLRRRSTQRSMSSSTASSDDEHGRRSRRDSTSTKPTTVLSFDSGPHPAHIAQAPPAPPPQAQLPTTVLTAPPTATSAPLSHLTQATHSSPSSPLRNQPISFSAPTTALPSPTTEAGPSRLGATSHSTTTSGTPASSSPLSGSPPRRTSLELFQAPKHSHPHPRDNPHPSSPPGDNASTLTLASSTFASVPTPTSASPLSPSVNNAPFNPGPGPGASRLRDFTSASTPASFSAQIRPTSLATSPSVTFAPAPEGVDRPLSAYDPNSYAASFVPSVPSVYALSAYPASLAGNMSIRTTGGASSGWGRGNNAADRDASVRAVRRKGSWESNESGWSWKGQGQGMGGPFLGSTGGGSLRPGTYESGGGGDDGFAAYYGAAGVGGRDGMRDGVRDGVRDSFVAGGMAGQRGLSRGSRGSGSVGRTKSDLDDEAQGFAMEERRVEMERAGAAVVA